MTYAACEGWKNLLTLSPDLGLQTAGHYMPVVPQGQRNTKRQKHQRNTPNPIENTNCDCIDFSENCRYMWYKLQHPVLLS